MARNGIAISVDPKLGKTNAGLIWLPVPETGVPEWMLSLKRDASIPNYPIRSALCVEGAKPGMDVHPLSVADATWEAVVAAAESLRAEMVERSAKLAAANAECEALIAEHEAAIANPEPSRLLMREEAPWGYAWDCRCASAPGSDLEHKAALDRARWAAQSEAVRRTREIATAFADTATDDEFMRAFDNLDAQRFDLLERRNRIETARAEEMKATQRSAIRAKIAYAPAHILERFDADRLPDDELREALADAVFSAIMLPPYEKINDSEVEHDEDCCAPEIKIKSCEYTGELDSEEWEAWKSAKAAIEAAGFEAKLRLVTAYCTETDCRGSVSRLQARVEADVGGLTVIRAYAVE